MPEAEVLSAARRWARQIRRDHPEVVRVGYFGSYARGDYVPGSDLDVLVELSRCEVARWQDRSPVYQPTGFPVGVDTFAYTSEELSRLRVASDAFIRTIDSEVKWLT